MKEKADASKNMNTVHLENNLNIQLSLSIDKWVENGCRNDIVISKGLSKMRLQFVNNLQSQNQYEKIVLEILEINMGYETYQRC